MITIPRSSAAVGCAIAKFDFEKVNVQETIKVVIENIKYLALKDNIAISMEIPEDLSPVLSVIEVI